MKLVGVIGGMGSKATIDFLYKVTILTPAHMDQEHLKMIVYMNPQIPDRTQAILEKGPSPLVKLVESARQLENAHVDFIVMPCVTAHYWLKEMRASVNIPILSIIESTLEKVKKEKKKFKRIGMLTTNGVIKTQLFDSVFEPAGYEIVTPDDATQENCVMKGIYNIKAGVDPAKTKSLFLPACENLLANSVDSIIAACTEIPLAITQEDLEIPLIDVNEALAEATIKFATDNL